MNNDKLNIISTTATNSQGWLYKRSNKTLSREWSKKYVVLLSVGKLLYYHSLNVIMTGVLDGKLSGGSVW